MHSDYGSVHFNHDYSIFKAEMSGIGIPNKSNKRKVTIFSVNNRSKAYVFYMYAKRKEY